MRLILLYTSLLAMLVTLAGCETQKNFSKAVRYYHLNGLSSSVEDGVKVYTYPSKIGGAELATIDMSLLKPSGTKGCNFLKEKSGQKAICFGNCYEEAKVYKAAYVGCNSAIVRYTKEEKDKKREAYRANLYRETQEANKKRAIEALTKYAEEKSLDAGSLHFYEQPISLEDIMKDILKGKVKVNTYFYVKCCEGYEVAQPINGGYRLATKNYKGLPILLNTSKTMFEGNKAGRGLGWLRYEAVSSYTNVIGSAKQAVVMADVLIK
jgi:hypothetical protein